MLASAALAYPAASPRSSLPHSCDRSTFTTLRPAISACTMEGFPVRGSRTPKAPRGLLRRSPFTAGPDGAVRIAGNGHPADPAGHPSACSLLIEEPVRCVAEEVGLEVSQGHVPVDLQPVALVGDVTAVRVLDEHHLEHVGRPRCEPDGRVGAGDRLAGLPDRVPGNRPEIVVDGQGLVQPRMVSVALPGPPPYLLKNPSAMLARKLDSKTARVMSPWISRR